MAKLPDHVGIDFGTHSVKAVELSNITTNPKLVNFGSQVTPQGVINSQDKKDQKQLADVVKKLYSDGRIKNSLIALILYELKTIL